MKLSCALTPGPDAPDTAAHAEALGYERVWFYDSPALYGDVFATMARTLDRTERIGVGAGVLVPSLRHVVTTAAAIGSIEAQAPGRLTVAIGTGFTGRALIGKKAIPWQTVSEFVAALRLLLAGEEARVDGEVCKLIHPGNLIAPRPIRTPLLIAAGGERALAIAQEIGDGVMCAGVIPAGARDVAMLTFGTVLDDDESFESARVLDAIGGAIAVIYHAAYATGGATAVDGLPGGPGWREEIEKFPEAVRHLHVHEGHCVAATERDRRHMVPALGATTFTGTPAQLRDRIVAYEAQGVVELVYGPMGSDIPGELERMKRALG